MSHFQKQHGVKSKQHIQTGMEGSQLGDRISLAQSLIQRDERMYRRERVLEGCIKYNGYCAPSPLLENNVRV